MTDTQTQTEVERVIAGLNAGTGFRPVAPEIAERAASLLASQSAEIERLKAERDEAQQWLGEEQARAEAAEAKLEEARKALEPTDGMVIAFMAEFEKWSSVLRYRGIDKWHATDIAGVRHGLREARALLSPEAKEKGNG